MTNGIGATVLPDAKHQFANQIRLDREIAECLQYSVPAFQGGPTGRPRNRTRSAYKQVPSPELSRLLPVPRTWGRQAPEPAAAFPRQWAR